MSTRVQPPTNIMAPAVAALPSRDNNGAAAAEPIPAKTQPITIRLSGWIAGARAEVEAAILLGQLRPFVAALAARGFAADPPPTRFDLTPDGDPICPKHRAPMRCRQKQGDTWHSHKILGPGGEELFCRGYAGAESPGYAVPLPPE